MSIYPQSFQILDRYNVSRLAFYLAANTNAEPFPSFDIEINQEDKDSDIDNLSTENISAYR